MMIGLWITQRKRNTTRILFVDVCNGHCYSDPQCTIVEMVGHVTKSDLRWAENMQPGLGRTGGDWKKIAKYLEKYPHIVWAGKKSELSQTLADTSYDIKYKLADGNY